MNLEFNRTEDVLPLIREQVLAKYHDGWRVLIRDLNGWKWNGGITDPPEQWAYLP